MNLKISFNELLVQAKRENNAVKFKIEVYLLLYLMMIIFLEGFLSLVQVYLENNVIT